VKQTTCFQNIKKGLLKFIFCFVLAVPAFVAAGQGDTLLLKDEEEQNQDAVVDDEEDDDNTEGYFLDNYLADSFIVAERRVPDSVIKKLQEDDSFWYVKADLPKKKKEVQQKAEYLPWWRQQWVRTIIWGLIFVGFAIAIILFLAGSNIHLFRKKSKREQIVDAEEISEDIFAINYQKEIDKAVSIGNFRLAVRLHFLQLLKSMSERNIIRYQQDKTNFDYLMELHNTSYYDDFFRVTRNYEYSWYGQFAVSEDAYRQIELAFNSIKKKVHF